MARDTSIMEYTAEDLIAHKLQRTGLLVAKPKFDQDGADLLAFLDVKDNAKFCRIQCKGRSLLGSSTSHVNIPTKYASDGFVLFLFVETGDKEITYLFCFLGREIRASDSPWKLSNNSYVLNLTPSMLTQTLSPFIFNDQKIGKIKKAIIDMNVTGEFTIMVHGYIEEVMPAMTCSAGSSSPNVPTDP